MARRYFVALGSILWLGLCATLTAISAHAAKPGGGSVQNCAGAVPSFVFNRAVSGSTRKDIFLANAAATCTQFLFSVTAGSYVRALSFRIVEQPGGVRQGRVLATDGLNVLRLVRFTIGDDMVLSNLQDDVVFEPSQSGFIDEGFDLAADGRRLVYVTADETAESDAVITPAASRIYRMRVLADVGACADAVTPCRYDAGPLVTERTGSSFRLEFPRWSVDGSAIFVVDYEGDAWSPNISRIRLPTPTDPLETVIKVSRGLARELTLYQVRPDPTVAEVLIYGAKPLVGPNGSKCRELRVSRSSDGTRVDSATRVLVGGGASQQSADAASRRLVLDGAKESKTGVCSSTGTLLSAIDNGSTVQLTSLTNGFRPATP